MKCEIVLQTTILWQGKSRLGVRYSIYVHYFSYFKIVPSKQKFENELYVIQTQLKQNFSIEYLLFSFY